MSRDAKFGYGFLFAGVPVAYLISKFFGTWAGALGALACGIIGVCFLVSAHRHGKGTQLAAEKTGGTEAAQQLRRLYLQVIGRIFGWPFPPKTRNEEAEKSPTQFRIIGCELRSCGSHGRDIFLRAKVELVTPVELAIEGYSVELSRGGTTESSTVIDDVRKWRLLSRSQNPPSSQGLAALPVSLRSGHPVEGWIHFATTKNQYEVQSGQMRLFVHSSRGDGFADIPCSSEYWNVTQENFLFFSESDTVDPDKKSATRN
jgi:hypothetical protein